MSKINFKIESVQDKTFTLGIYDIQETLISLTTKANDGTISNSDINLPTYQGATNASNGVSGLVPAAPSADSDKFLKGDGTWSELTLPSNYQGATLSASGVAGLVPAATSAQKDSFLKGDGTWATITLPDGATASEIQTGTVTTAKTVSPKILHDYVVGEVASGVAGLVNSAPATLDTLNELATALGNDPNFATTISGQIGGKLDASSADYVKSLSISGQTITVTKGDNTTGTLTTQDTTYSAGTGLDLSGTTFSVASTAGTSTLAWNSEVTLGTVGGLAIKAKLPVNPDTHKTTHLYAGSSGATANAATTTNTTTFLTVVDDTTASNSIQITGSGGTSVTAAAGVITIDTPEISSITNAQIDAMFA